MAITLTKKRFDEIARQAGEFRALLGRGKKVLVTTHVSPDGDAIASLLAAAEIVKRMGGHATSALDGVVPRRFDFLPGADKIISDANPNRDLRAGVWDVLLIVDCGSLARIGKVTDWVASGTPLIAVDHHPDNTRFAHWNLVFPDASSTSEILYHLARALDLAISPDLATLLYTGLLTDTGGFRFSNTDPGAFEAAAQLSSSGIDPHTIANAVYRANSAASIRLLGQALCSLELTADGRLATMMIQNSPAQEGYEDVIDFGLAVKGVQIAAYFRVNHDTVRVSLRSGGDHDVAQIARQFGGGGHPRAAGFSLQGEYSEIHKRVMESLVAELAYPAIPIVEKG